VIWKNNPVKRIIMNQGFIRVAPAIPPVWVGNCRLNTSGIEEMIFQAEENQVAVISFPELSISGYTCADLFLHQQLLNEAEEALKTILVNTFNTKILAIVGMPLRVNQQLFNVAVVFQSGKILGIVPKTHLPNNNEFYEKRWFTPAQDSHNGFISFNGSEIPFGKDLIFTSDEFSFGIEICEDLWVPQPPGTQLSLQGADMIFNLSATNELTGKHQYLRQLIEQQSGRCNGAYIYSSAGFGESSTDVVYAGNAIVAENGKIIASSDRFSFDPQMIITEIDIQKLRAERLRNSNFFNDRKDIKYRKVEFIHPAFKLNKLNRTFDKHPFVPQAGNRDSACEEIFSIQVGGLAQRWKHTQAQTVVVGISGGLDSTLALLVCVKTADKLGYDRKKIVGITMPGFGTTDRTYNNAINLMKSLGITMHEISIKEACLQHFKDINHDINIHDVTYENTQARERTQILMDMANKTGGLVIGTGDLSELALGWATYNGDHMSMYGVNSGVPKTLVRYLVDWASHQLDDFSESILKDVLDTPVSPELLPADAKGKIAQKTEDIVGPYELHDFFLYYFVRFGFTPKKIFFLACNAFESDYQKDIIEKWLRVFLRRFFAQQFKRSCLPDGPKVGSINLSPRGDWRMPSDASIFDFEI
jgi:NAD+ synthase (glutamine-hydrolysing)